MNAALLPPFGRWSAAFFIFLGLLALLQPPDAMAQPEGNPLPPCPETPNCVRETHVFVDAEPAELFEDALGALGALGPARVETAPDRRHVAAVFRVVLFKDDVQLAVTAHDEGAALHLRSASRMGSYDFGVNRRRVDRFLRELEQRL